MFNKDETITELQLFKYQPRIRQIIPEGDGAQNERYAHPSTFVGDDDGSGGGYKAVDVWESDRIHDGLLILLAEVDARLEALEDRMVALTMAAELVLSGRMLAQLEKEGHSCSIPSSV